MLPFAGNADLEAYLDWELAIEQKFNSHLVPAKHRVYWFCSIYGGMTYAMLKLLLYLKLGMF